jgi:hypothetical protein
MPRIELVFFPWLLFRLLYIENLLDFMSLGYDTSTVTTATCSVSSKAHQKYMYRPT